MSGKIQIGKYKLEKGLVLAPMAGVTDRSFRRICRQCGAEYTVSEMISAKALCYESRSGKGTVRKTASLAAVMADEAPMAVQIFGSDPEFMAEAARILESGGYGDIPGSIPPTAIDINMGCPVHKVAGNGEGSALMKNQALASEIVRAVTRAVSIPVTVKIRAGWDAEHINAPEFAKAMEDAGATLICVHARTKAQMYTPGVDIGIIGKVKLAVSVPVIGNGDIWSAEDAIKMFDETGCDGIMAARGALGNPWLFSEFSAAIDGKAFVRPDMREVFSTALVQVRNMITEKGDKIGIAEAKKHVAWYIRDIKGAASARQSVMLAEKYDDFEKVLGKLLTDSQ